MVSFNFRFDVDSEQPVEQGGRNTSGTAGSAAAQTPPAEGICSSNDIFYVSGTVSGTLPPAGAVPSRADVGTTPSRVDTGTTIQRCRTQTAPPEEVEMIMPSGKFSRDKYFELLRQKGIIGELVESEGYISTFRSRSEGMWTNAKYAFIGGVGLSIAIGALAPWRNPLAIACLAGAAVQGVVLGAKTKDLRITGVNEFRFEYDRVLERFKQPSNVSERPLFGAKVQALADIIDYIQQAPLEDGTIQLQNQSLANSRQAVVSNLCTAAVRIANSVAVFNQIYHSGEHFAQTELLSFNNLLEQQAGEALSRVKIEYMAQNYDWQLRKIAGGTAIPAVLCFDFIAPLVSFFYSLPSM